MSFTFTAAQLAEINALKLGAENPPINTILAGHSLGSGLARFSA
jgi:hypothetical protein